MLYYMLCNKAKTKAQSKVISGGLYNCYLEHAYPCIFWLFVPGGLPWAHLTYLQ